LSRMY